MLPDSLHPVSIRIGHFGSSQAAAVGSDRQPLLPSSTGKSLKNDTLFHVFAESVLNFSWYLLSKPGASHVCQVLPSARDGDGTPAVSHCSGYTSCLLSLSACCAHCVPQTDICGPELGGFTQLTLLALVLLFVAHTHRSLWQAKLDLLHSNTLSLSASSLLRSLLYGWGGSSVDEVLVIKTGGPNHPQYPQKPGVTSALGANTG